MNRSQLSPSAELLARWLSRQLLGKAEVPLPAQHALQTLSPHEPSERLALLREVLNARPELNRAVSPPVSL